MFKRIVPHILIVLSVVLIVFFILDQANSAMCFINNQATKIILLIHCVITLAASICFAVADRK
ncbi:MAG: hypothetical protein IJD14_04440 [Christensenellaceae bacterium]|nr:hypothetical protein [Christensenellaceae bacterium]